MSVDENLELYREMLKVYLRGVGPRTGYGAFYSQLRYVDPGRRLEAYTLYFAELNLNYPCKIRGRALKAHIDEDAEQIRELFPNMSISEILKLCKGGRWGQRL